MYVRGKSIIVGLALLLVGSYASAGDIGKLRTQYESLKKQYIQNQNLSPENLSTLSSRLDTIEGNLTTKIQQGASTTYSKPIQRWIAEQRAWLAGMMPVSAAPEQKRGAAYEKVKAEQEAAREETKRQQNRLNQFVIDARGAFKNRQLNVLNEIYNEAQAVIPTLVNILPAYQQATLGAIRRSRDELEKILKGGKEGKQAQAQVLSPAEAQQALNDIINKFREAWFSNDKETQQAATKEVYDLLSSQPNIPAEQIKKALDDINELMKAPQIEMGTATAYAPAGTLIPGAGAGEPITKQGAQPGYAAISGTEKAKKQFAAL
ncbi:MAG: hypothetical protein ACHQVS_05460, partial [Candidatus Babeliales bacterium]